MFGVCNYGNVDVCRIVIGWCKCYELVGIVYNCGCLRFGGIVYREEFFVVEVVVEKVGVGMGDFV